MRETSSDVLLFTASGGVEKLGEKGRIFLPFSEDWFFFWTKVLRLDKIFIKTYVKTRVKTSHVMARLPLVPPAETPQKIDPNDKL